MNIIPKINREERNVLREGRKNLDLILIFIIANFAY